MKNGIQTAVYYFPNWHTDPFAERKHGKGWTEWELLKHATPRYEGHYQPKVPLWGYEDEADPVVMEKKINAAADHGIDCFLFDWYWFENRSFLSRCLEEGYMNAKNNDRLKFALMYANHKNWQNNFPALAHQAPENELTCIVDEKTFIEATDYCIEKYFSHPNYWRVNGGLYFSFYELSTLIDSLGGIDNCKRVIGEFRERVRKAGLGELHLNAIIFNVRVLKGEGILSSPKEQLEFLGFDSATSYVWAHHQAFDFLHHSYDKIKKKVFEDIKNYEEQLTVPFYPNATMSWDSSGRCCPSDVYGNYGYPFTGILEITPEQFKDQLESLKAYLETRPEDERILTVNAWNEWTEGSYLEPDTKHGYAYLEAFKEVFGE